MVRGEKTEGGIIHSVGVGTDMKEGEIECESGEAASSAQVTFLLNCVPAAAEASGESDHASFILILLC